MPPSAKEGLFKPSVPAREKADHTTAAARAIIADEAAARIRKTERLRQLRLEAAPPADEPGKSPARKRVARKS